MTAPIDRIVAALAGLPYDEQRVVARVVEDTAGRLRIGLAQYGALQLDTDSRDWQQQAREELLDGSVYLAIAAERTPVEVALFVTEEYTDDHADDAQNVTSGSVECEGCEKCQIELIGPLNPIHELP